MAQQTRVTVKTYFQTGDTPTEAQFIDLIDSALNLTDDDSDDITEGVTNLFLTTSERSKLSGIEASADVTDANNVGAVNAAATSKVTPVDADSVPIVDSEAANVIKRVTFTNLKAFLKTYFDAIYQAVGSYITASSADTLTNKTIDADNNTVTNIGTSELSDAGVTLAKMANIATNSIIGRVTAATGVPESLTAAQVRTIINVEDGADVTDATNVDAAGATMNTDTNVSGNSWVVDEDNMASDTATKVPTQQSVKAYVDTVAAAKAGLTQTDFISGIIETPADQDYKLVIQVPYAGTITSTTTQSLSGTCTATFKVNTTALGGTANAVSSTEVEQAHSTSNTFAAGDNIVLTVSSNSSCADMSFTIKFTRTLS